MLKEATQDAGYAYLEPDRDLPTLLVFLQQFDRLGWFPPVTLEKQRLLAAHDVTMHFVRDDLCFYEFCSKGARGERDPWLSIFFHVASDSRIRICGVIPTRRLDRRRSQFVERVEARVKELSRWIKLREER